MKVLTILGTRPEIIRLSRVMAALDQVVEHKIVHTGQNYDYELNDVFFDELGVRRPDYFLDVDTSTLGRTLGGILSKTEEVLLKEQPDAVLVLGDTNSATATIMGKRMKIPTYHMEAGNRSFDANVPEEINRKLANGGNIRFVGYQPIEVAKAAMRQVDAGFVSLVPGMYQYAYPSKTMTYLEQGCPLIVAVEPESELAREATAQGFGFCISVGNSGVLSELLTTLADDRSEIAEMRKAASAKFQSSFSEAAVLAEWSRILSESGANEEVPRLESR